MLAHVLPSNERAAASARSTLVERDRQAPGRAVRPVVQARHRRPAREPAGRAGRAAHRQGLRPADLRRQRRPVPADRARTATTSRAALPHLGELLSNSVDDGARARRGVRRRAASDRAGAVDALGGADDRAIIDLVRLPDAEARRATDVRGHRLVAWRGTRPHPGREPVGAVRPAGLAGEHARCATRAARSRSSARGAPSGTPSRRRDRRRARSTATRCAAATGGPLGYLREYGSALWHTLPARAAREVGPVDVVHACNPPDLLFLVALPLQAARRAVRVRPARPGARAVPVAVRRGEDLLYRAVCRAGAADLRGRRRGDRDQRELPRGRDRPRRQGARSTVFVVRSAPDRRAVPRRCRRTRRCKRGKPYLLCYLGVMGPQDGVDYALRALAQPARRARARRLARGVRRRRATPSTTMVALSRRARPGRLRRVHRPGPRRGPCMRYLSTADVCLSPDPLNPLNDVSTMNKVMEYMAMGRPIVSFDLREARVSAGDAAVYAPANDEARVRRADRRAAGRPGTPGADGRARPRARGAVALLEHLPRAPARGLRGRALGLNQASR